MMDFLKVSILVFVWFFVLFIFFYYVNLASTRGYFLRQANQDHNAVNFQFEILKTELLTCKQKNWEKVHTKRYQNDVVSVETEVVYVPEMFELTYLK